MKNLTRLLSLLAVAALFANALLPSFAIHAPGKIAGFGNGKILICTGESFKWVKIADLRSGREKPKAHNGGSCPLCAAAHALISASAPFVLLRGTQRLPVEVAYAPPGVFSLSPHANSRAPPSSFIG